MKKLIITILCSFSITAFAQNGFFLQPLAGIGAGNIKVTSPGYVQPSKSIISYDVNLGIGYRLHHWLFSSGLGYLRTGAKETIEFTNVLGEPIGSGYYYSYYSHLIVPLSAGYEMVHGKKFIIRPSIGADIAYNLSERESTNPLLSSKTEPMPAARFDSTFKRLSIFGVVRVNVDYIISPRLSITIAPTLDYMLTNMLKPHSAAPYDVNQKNYALLFNAGIKWSLPHKRTSQKAATGK